MKPACASTRLSTARTAELGLPPEITPTSTSEPSSPREPPSTRNKRERDDSCESHRAEILVASLRECAAAVRR